MGIEEVEGVLVIVANILTVAENLEVKADAMGRTGKLSVITLPVQVDISEAEPEVIVLSTIDMVTVR